MTHQVFSTAFFEKKIKDLSRKYRRIRYDFGDLIEELGKGPYAGDRIPGCIGPVFKCRMSSRDMQRGKSGGFRIIYLVRENEKAVYLLTIYPKSERENIDATEINRTLLKTGLGR